VSAERSIKGRWKVYRGDEEKNLPAEREEEKVQRPNSYSNRTKGAVGEEKRRRSLI